MMKKIFFAIFAFSFFLCAGDIFAFGKKDKKNTVIAEISVYGTYPNNFLGITTDKGKIYALDFSETKYTFKELSALQGCRLKITGKAIKRKSGEGYFELKNGVFSAETIEKY